MNEAVRGTITPKVGDRLPELVIRITRKLIIAGATTSRDWQPQHHDKDAAKTAGLSDIIMNNYTQAGLISRYITDWSGPIGRIGRLKFAMRRPIYPDRDVRFAGSVVAVDRDGGQISWVKVDITLSDADTLLTSASVKFALPAYISAKSPWHCHPSEWRP